jgi:Xaa-Pro aminopeptidase
VHFPLTEFDIAVARKVGAESDAAFQKVCRDIQPGDSERKIAGMLMGEFFSQGFYASVMLVGSDERLYKFRHCLPTEKPVDKLVLMHVAGHKYGFHANVTRMVHFGQIPEELHHRFRVVSTLNAMLLSYLEPGIPFTVLGEKMKEAYNQLGWGDEWKGHVQGFPCGYETCYDNWASHPDALAGYNQAYDWLQTIPGVKTEELSLFTQDKGAEIISVGSDWPVLPVQAGDKTWHEPDILTR